MGCFRTQTVALFMAIILVYNIVDSLEVESPINGNETKVIETRSNRPIRHKKLMKHENIRTILPKSIREVAHSPPKNQNNPLISDSLLETYSTPLSTKTNKIPAIVTMDCTSPLMNTYKINTKTNKESFPFKTYGQNQVEIIENSSSESTHFDEMHSICTSRRIMKNFFIIE